MLQRSGSYGDGLNAEIDAIYTWLNRNPNFQGMEVSASTTLTALNAGLIKGNTTTKALKTMLPSAVGLQGLTFAFLFVVGANAWTIANSDGTTISTLEYANDVVIVQSDNGSWRIIAQSLKTLTNPVINAPDINDGTWYGTIDGAWTASGQICANLGTVTTADINGGTIDGATIATSDITVGAGKTLNVSAGTLALADNQISGDKVEGGAIAAIAIGALTLTSMAGNWTNAGRTIADLGIVTTVDINGGSIDNTPIGAASASTGSFTTLGVSEVSTLQNDVNVSATKKVYFDGGGDTYIQESASNVLSFYTGGTLGLQLYSNLGYATLQTGQRFYFDGGGDTYIYESASNVLDFRIGAALNFQLTNGGVYLYNLQTAAVTALGVGAGGLIYKNSSSQRYKKNIKNLSVDTTHLYDLKPREFDFKSNEQHTFGFIAEEVNEYFPDIVIKNEKGECESIHSDGLVSILVAEMKKMQKRIIKLETN